MTFGAILLDSVIAGEVLIKNKPAPLVEAQAHNLLINLMIND